MNFELDLHHSPSYTHPIQTANNNRLTTLFPTKHSQPFAETQSAETFFLGRFAARLFLKPNLSKKAITFLRQLHFIVFLC